MCGGGSTPQYYGYGDGGRFSQGSVRWRDLQICRVEPHGEIVQRNGAKMNNEELGLWKSSLAMGNLCRARTATLSIIFTLFIIFTLLYVPLADLRSNDEQRSIFRRQTLQTASDHLRRLKQSRFLHLIASIPNLFNDTTVCFSYFRFLSSLTVLLQFPTIVIPED